MNFRNTLSACFFATLLLFSGCLEDTPSADDAPELPSIETLQAAVHMSAFVEGSTQARAGSQSNWVGARFFVSVWNVYLAAGLAIPVGAFQAVISE